MLNYEEILVDWDTLRRNPFLFRILIQPSVSDGDQRPRALSFDLGTDNAGNDELLAEVLRRCLYHQCFPCVIEDVTDDHADLDRYALTMRMWLVAQRFCMVHVQKETVRFMAALLHKLPLPKLAQVVDLLKILYQEAPPKLHAGGMSAVPLPSPRTRLWYGEARAQSDAETSTLSQLTCSTCRQAMRPCMIKMAHLAKSRSSR